MNNTNNTKKSSTPVISNNQSSPMKESDTTKSQSPIQTGPASSAPPSAAAGAPITITFVCVECGSLSKIIRHLQNDNYCLEKCKRCNETADKYVEYDSNLKILSVLLCFPQIHRHIFFNVDSIKNIKIKCYLLTFFLLFLFYLHESKVNYRRFLEEQFIAEVREITLRDFKNGKFNSMENNVTNEGTEPDFYQLTGILQEALKNIDEEKLYTKHIFDRFDLEALITTIVKSGSYLAVIIASAYIFKKIQMNFYNRQKRDMKMPNRQIKASYELEGFQLFYRVWYCVIISQITYCGIIVEIIWSYNQQNNFFFWLQVYSGYSMYTCLNAILHNKFEKYLPILFLGLSILASRLSYLVVAKVYSGVSLRSLEISELKF